MVGTSLIISHYRIREELDEHLMACVKSIPAEEKIIIVNDGIGMGKALNIGLKMAQGEYLIVSNNDCILRGDLNKMLDPKAVTYPKEMGAPRSFFCMPRSVYDKVGGYDEQFNFAYFEDDDLIMRWRKAGIEIKGVDVQLEHDPGRTLDKHPDRNVFFYENQTKFEAKWGTSRS